MVPQKFPVKFLASVALGIFRVWVPLLTSSQLPLHGRHRRRSSVMINAFRSLSENDLKFHCSITVVLRHSFSAAAFSCLL